MKIDTIFTREPPLLYTIISFFTIDTIHWFEAAEKRKAYFCHNLSFRRTNKSQKSNNIMFQLRDIEILRYLAQTT